MNLRCKDCASTVSLGDDERIPMACPSCLLDSALVDCVSATQPMVTEPWFLNVEAARRIAMETNLGETQ